MPITPLSTKLLAALVLLCAFFGQSPAASAQIKDSYLMAQSDPDEAYDPFADYSEFDEDSDEEADINFFRNGRFFTVGLVAGIRNFTGNLGKSYAQGPAYGVTMTYFFDLRSAFVMSYVTGDHGVNFTTDGKTKTYSGNVSMTSLSMDFKYYFNTQNITRGLADLNPYGLVGFSQNYRTYSLDNFEGSARDAAMGVDLGAGLEIPLMRKKGFLGIEACYHMVNFADETKEFVGSQKLDQTLSGDYYNLTFVLGMNF